MKEVTGSVVNLKKVSPETFILTIQSPYIAHNSIPGQFVHVQCGRDRSYILRRPFSIHRVQGGYIDLFFRVKGKGTRWLSRRRKHDEINMIGPLGRGFTLPRKGQTALLVAGGMGVAPMMFLADSIVKKQGKFVFAYGAKCRDELHFYIDVKRISHRLICTTEDGSYGMTGKVIDSLGPIVEQERVSLIYACGPTAMLESLAQFCNRTDIECQVALEEKMACGIGACLSCVCKIRHQDIESYRRVCVDGPVFDIKEVVWE